MQKGRSGGGGGGGGNAYVINGRPLLPPKHKIIPGQFPGSHLVVVVGGGGCCCISITGGGGGCCSCNFASFFSEEVGG